MDLDLDTMFNEINETIFHVASRRGNTERVKFLLREFPNLLVELTKSNYTALHLAAYGGHTVVAEVLIDAARHLPNDDTLDITFFQAFLRKGDGRMYTALHVAVEKRHVDIVKLLVEADPTDRHIQNNQGKTPMYIAVEEGFHEIVEIISTTCTAPSLDGPFGEQTALHMAVYGEQTDMVEFLIKAARHLPSSSANDDTLHNPLTSFQAFLRQADVRMNTALLVAVEKGHVDIVKLLVEADPTDRHSQNRDGKTPMYIAVEERFHHIVEIISTTCTAPSLDGPYGDTVVRIDNLDQVYGGHTKVVEFLIKAASHLPFSSANDVTSFGAFLREGDKDMETALHVAVKKGHVDIVKLLVEADPFDRHSQNREGKTPLYIAVEEGFHEILKIICTTCRRPYLYGPGGTTALHAAIKKRDKDSVLRLLKDTEHAKHLATVVDDKGWTPLHYAAFHEFDSVLDAIIEAQKDLWCKLNYVDMDQTPLLVAAEKGYTSTVIRLMKLWPTSSSACTAIDNHGRNILHLAAAKNKKEMIQGILKYCPEKYKHMILKKQDDDGNTPLHLLISHGCFIPELIKHRGLDTMVRNNMNWTPRDMLYSTDKITADQVKIKIALDDVQTNQSRKFWRTKFWGTNMKKKTDILETDILESLVLPSKRETKDVKFNKDGKKLMDEKRAQMKKDLERYKKRTSTQIVVATLITTITFTVGFTMPGGLHQSGEEDEGLVVLTKKAAFNAFMVSDAIAFLLSTCSLFLYFLESMNEDPLQVSKLNAASVVLNIVSVMALMLTFITGTYVVLSHSAAIAITVCLIGSFFFIFVIVLLIKSVYDHQVKRNED